jgi:hypothetical protein
MCKLYAVLTPDVKCLTAAWFGVAQGRTDNAIKNHWNSLKRRVPSDTSKAHRKRKSQPSTPVDGPGAVNKKRSASQPHPSAGMSVTLLDLRGIT